MKLKRNILQTLRSNSDLIVPGEGIFDLPEKVLQFGTGVLLRGLPDYFIDKANRQGIFNGRIVVVKSTSQGSGDLFGEQDNLYTVTVRGIENGKTINETIIHSAISRVLNAGTEWKNIIECAANPQMEIIISNTTEIGITYLEESITSGTPVSFPGKLLAFLLARYTAFNGSSESGMIIIPTELIPGNGEKLKAVLGELASYNRLDSDFVKWMFEANHFCSSLVDRIVPGKLPDHEQSATEKKTGYTDKLMIMAEPFRLWAIESGNEHVKSKLSFSTADEGVRIEASIEKFRELKLRLLNGTHTFSCGIAILAGFRTVKEAMEDEGFSNFIQSLMIEEICPAIAGELISSEEAVSFAKNVAERFRNPFLEHQWKSITLQYSSKMKMRNVPILLNHYRQHSFAPACMSLGVAGYILLLENEAKAVSFKEENGNTNIVDDNAHVFDGAWELASVHDRVSFILGKEEFWGTNLSSLPGFCRSVELNLTALKEKGAAQMLQELLIKKVPA